MIKSATTWQHCRDQYIHLQVILIPAGMSGVSPVLSSDSLCTQLASVLVLSTGTASLPPAADPHPLEVTDWGLQQRESLEEWSFRRENRNCELKDGETLRRKAEGMTVTVNMSHLPHQSNHVIHYWYENSDYKIKCNLQNMIRFTHGSETAVLCIW